MTKKPFALAGSAALALALTACGGNDADEVDQAALEADRTAVTQTEEFDPMTRDFTLSEEAQARRDEFDVDAFQEEYGTYRDEIVAGGEQPNGTTGGTTAEASADSPRLPERSAMSWSYLDRNGDGKLSVAEYAIWAIPLDPNAPKRDDETKPYVTAEQANQAANSFFYYDTDGDTYLSQREFTAARRGEEFA